MGCVSRLQRFANLCTLHGVQVLDDVAAAATWKGACADTLRFMPHVVEVNHMGLAVRAGWLHGSFAYVGGSHREG